MKAAEGLDERLRELTGFRLNEETPLPCAHAVKAPTLMAHHRPRQCNATWCGQSRSIVDFDSSPFRRVIAPLIWALYYLLPLSTRSASSSSFAASLSTRSLAC